MFHLHETTRKRAIRAAFLLLCVAPTLVCASWIAYSMRPWRVNDEQARLGGLLHVSATATDWQTPRPGVVTATRLVLAELGAVAPLVELNGVVVDCRGKGTTIAAQSSTTDAAQLRALATKLPRWLAALGGDSLQLRIDRFAVRRSDAVDAIEFRDIAISVDSADDGAFTSRLVARRGAEPDAAAVSTQWVFAAATTQPANRATIDARQAPLPCWLIAIAAPALDAGGDDSEFAGLVHLDLVNGQVAGAVQGRLENVALGATLPAGSPHEIHGSADVTIDELRWRGRQIEQLTGSVRAAEVRVSRSLLDAAARVLYCSSVGADMQPGDATVTTLDLLACKFHLDRKGLTVTGDLPPETGLSAECLAATAGQAVLMQPPYVELPAGAWVQFVAAPGTSWVPATQEAIDIAERMPLPVGQQDR